MMQELVEIINTVKEKFTDDSDLLWTSYDNAKEVRDELDGHIEQLNQGDKSCLEKLDIHFSPTSTFQEHSIQNGWTKEYMELANRFDIIHSWL
jgi:hypothetical protein